MRSSLHRVGVSVFFLRERLYMGNERALHPAQVTATKSSDADGAGGAIVRDEDGVAVRALLQRHFGNDRDSQPGADHGQDAGELAALEDDVRQHAGALAGLKGGLPKAVVFAQQEERIIAQLLELQLALFRQRMVARQDGKQPFGAQRESLNVVAADGERENG